jgi:drug/metabolite transporter (DMT)-like permease
VTSPASRPAPRPPGRQVDGAAGFACGLVGLVLSWLIPLMGVLLGLLGVVLGGVGVSRSRRAGAGGGLSVAGVVLGVLAVVVAIVFWIAYAHQLSNR